MGWHGPKMPPTIVGVSMLRDICYHYCKKSPHQRKECSTMKNKMDRTLATLVAMLVLAFEVQAETISLQRDDSTSGSGTPKSFATAGNWSIAEGKSEAEAPNSAYDYYAAHTLSTINKSDVGPFAGKSLTIGTGGAIWWFGAFGNTFYPGTDIIAMESGTYFRFTSMGDIGAGTFEIRGTEDAPVVFRVWYNPDNKPYSTSFAAAFKGSASSHVRFDRPLSNYFKHTINWGTASMLDFYGTLYLCEYIDFNATSFATPGTVIVETNGVFNLTASPGVSSFGRLNLLQGSSVSLKASHAMTVSNGISIAEGAMISCANLKPTTWTPTVATTPHTFLRLGKDAAAPDYDALAAAIKAATVATYGPLPRVVLTSVTNVDDSVDVTATYDEIVIQTNSCLRSVAMTPYGGTGDPAAYFSDGNPISADRDYYSAKAFYTAGGAYEFPGKSYSTYSKLGLYGGDVVTFAELNLLPASWIPWMSSIGAGNAYLKGTLNLYGGRIKPDAGGTIVIESNIGGPSNLLFQLAREKDESSGGGFGGKVVLAGDNSSFAQKIILGETAADTNLTLIASSDKNLGGDMADFTYDGVFIRETCRLVLDGTNTFTAANRGWFFDGAGEIVVTNEAIAVVRQPVTFDTSLAKTGAGSLILGAAPKFYDSGSGTAVDASNGATLDVTAGALGAAATNAFSGLAVTLAAGTSYVLPLDAGDAAFAERGADLTASGTSLVFVGETPLAAFALETVPVDAPIVRGVVTVSDIAAAEAILAKLRPQRASVDGVSLKCRLFVRPNEDGSVTVCVRYLRAGVTVYFR